MKNLNVKVFPCPLASSLPSGIPYALTRPPQQQKNLLSHKDQLFFYGARYTTPQTITFLSQSCNLVCADIFGELCKQCQYIISLKDRGWCRANQSDSLGRYWAVPTGSSQLKFTYALINFGSYITHYSAYFIRSFCLALANM